MNSSVLSRIKFPKLGAKAPDRVLLFKWGLNPTQEGPFFLTKESAKEIMDRFYEDGNVLPWDIDHSSENIDLPDEKRKAIGQFKLELDDQGIWAVNQWTDKAKELIESGGFSYFSPSFCSLNIGPGKIIKKIRAAAITNFPKMKQLDPFLMSEAGNMIKDKMNTMPSEALLTKVRPIKDLMSSTSMLMSTAQSYMSNFDKGIYSNNSLMDISKQITTVIPEWLEKIAEILDMEDPNGETEMQAKLSEDIKKTEDNMTDLKKEETEEKLEQNRFSELYEFAKQITGKTDIDEIKGVIRARTQNQKFLEDRLSEVEKNEVMLLVENGVRDGLIPPLEKDIFFNLSKKEVVSHLSHAVPMPKSMFEKTIDVSKPLIQAQMDEVYERDAKELIRKIMGEGK